MSRTSTMTIGFLLIFIGLQLNFVETYTLTPNATKFWVERFEYTESQAIETPFSTAGYQYSTQPFQQAAYQAFPTGMMPAKKITPANWLCWPVIFLGAFFVLHGAAIHRGP